jgi:hypothetical protein
MGNVKVVGIILWTSWLGKIPGLLRYILSESGPVTLKWAVVGSRQELKSGTHQ